jgi:UDP-N-acetylglucosamine--N-acetylmuramyl-(pentapeptide) pyrophosphoryl-undecaprenol N-acetylglucosamine transferase
MFIIFAGGGTLGSVTPLLAVAKEISRQRPGTEFLWLGTEGGPEDGQVHQAGLPFKAISSGKLRRYLAWRNFTDLFKITTGYFQARKLFKEKRPDIVVSAGGFVAVPVIWAAGHLDIPVHVHQMDIRPGLANKLSAPFATSFSVAYQKSIIDFAKLNPVWTGNPVRSALFGKKKEEAQQFFQLDANLPTIVVLGGGTGAVFLNQLVAKTAPLFNDKANIIHVTGKNKAVIPPEVATNYRQFELFGSHEMAMAYASADLVLTRAGMGTLTELASLGKPAVIVPIPKSHQEENAELFLDGGAAEVWPESSLFSKKMVDDLMTILSNADRLESLGEGMKKMNRSDAAEKIAKIIIQAVEREG